MKHISVLVSVYNEPLEWLKDSIESILNQTFKDFEFIIVNDNPDRDELKDTLNHYKITDDRIRIIANDKNIGLTKSLNKAIKAARGRYIARMDADDIALPERLCLQYEFLEKNSDIFLIGTSVQLIDQNGHVTGKAIKNENHSKVVKNMLHGKLAFYHPTIMFRNKDFLYREKFETTQDYDFYLNLLSKGKRFANLKDILLCYRVSNKSVSMNKKTKQIIYKYLALKFYYERRQNGFDSYDKLDFDDERQLINFLDLPQDKLEAEALKEKIVFALAAGDYETAQQAFRSYKKYNNIKTEKSILWLFTAFPKLHRLYRKLRYEILKF